MMVNCGHKGKHRISSNTWRGSGVERCRRAQREEKKTSSTPVTPPAPQPTWTVDTRKLGSMDSCRSSLQLTSFVGPGPTAASDLCSWLTGLEPDDLSTAVVAHHVKVRRGNLSYRSRSVSSYRSRLNKVLLSFFADFTTF